MANDVVIRAAEGCAAEASLLWDSVWDAEQGFADWVIADASEAMNRGGLRAQDAIATAVLLCLFTDRRVDPDHPLAYLADGDVRGYFGDAIDVRADLNEGPLGSLLWLLERAPMTIKGMPAARWAELFANEALATLLAQGVCARIDVSATADEIAGVILLSVALYGSDGARIYDRKYDVLWSQVAR